jgi:hypothetical protein
MSVTIISKLEYDVLCERNSYYKNRWSYLSVAARIVGELHPRSVLEIGPGGDGTPMLVRQAETLDRKGTPTYLHDARKMPWPVRRHYDLVIGLQVWEHLRGAQRRAFRETVRLGRYVLLSFPYEWENADEIHEGISFKKIRWWTCQHPMMRCVVVDQGTKRSRMICLFRASKNQNHVKRRK